MKKVAFFVEGPTEAFFIRSLLTELVTQQRIRFVECDLKGGSEGNPRVISILAEDILNPQQQYQINIYTCNADNHVNQDVIENLPTLQREGFTRVIALKDLRGDYKGIDGMMHAHVPTDYPQQKSIQSLIFRNSPILVTSIIAVMEIETWFLSETTHYERINSKLTQALITANRSSLGADPFVDDMEQVLKPAELLNDIYQLVRVNYSKKKSVRERTISKLDMAEIYFQLPDKLASLKELTQAIDSFL